MQNICNLFVTFLPLAIASKNKHFRVMLRTQPFPVIFN